MWSGRFITRSVKPSSPQVSRTLLRVVQSNMRVIFKDDELNLVDGLFIYLHHKARSRRRRRDAFRMEYQGAAAGCVVGGSSASASGYSHIPLPRIPLLFPAACLPSARATWWAGRPIPLHRAAKMNKHSFSLSCHDQTTVSWHLFKLNNSFGTLTSKGKVIPLQTRCGSEGG